MPTMLATGKLADRAAKRTPGALLGQRTWRHTQTKRERTSPFPILARVPTVICIMALLSALQPAHETRIARLGGRRTLKQTTSSMFLRGPGGPPEPPPPGGRLPGHGPVPSKSAYLPYPGGGGPSSRMDGCGGGSYASGGGMPGFGLSF